MELSFIIPVHNAAKTLKRAVTSLTNQSAPASSYEIILIENGSSDDSYVLCQELAQTFPQVRLFQSDKGVSKARNLGLNQAQGDYVVFIDADDRLPQGSLGTYLDLSQPADLTTYAFVKGDTRHQPTKSLHLLTGPDLESFRVQAIANPTSYLFVWAKRFKRSLIVRYNLAFKENLQLAEDSDFLIRYTYYCHTMIQDPRLAYVYETAAGSTVRKVDGQKAAAYQTALLETATWVDAEESPVIQEAFAWYVLMHFNLIMVREVYLLELPLRQKLARMCELANQLPFAQALKTVAGWRQLVKPARAPLVLIRYHLSLLAAAIYGIRIWQNHRKET